MAPAPTDRTRVRRVPQRGDYDRDTIDAILDETLISHVGFVHDGEPVVIPTLHARLGDRLYLHGSAASRLLRTLERGVPVCATSTKIDGLVPARWSEVRAPSRQELKATKVLSLPLGEASAKVRTGPPIDDDEDYALPVWAGVLPMRTVVDPPQPDPRLDPAIEIPGH